MQPDSAKRATKPHGQQTTKSTDDGPPRNAVPRGVHTTSETTADGGIVSEHVNQYKQTPDGALERARGARNQMRDGTTVADVLHELFEHDTEIGLFPQILAGIAEEMFVLGVALQSAAALDQDQAGTMLIRLSKRLDFALAFEQRRAEDPANYERDFDHEERQSGEFAVEAVPGRIVKAVPKPRTAGGDR